MCFDTWYDVSFWYFLVWCLISFWAIINLPRYSTFSSPSQVHDNIPSLAIKNLFWNWLVQIYHQYQSSLSPAPGPPLPKPPVPSDCIGSCNTCTNLGGWTSLPGPFCFASSNTCSQNYVGSTLTYFSHCGSSFETCGCPVSPSSTVYPLQSVGLPSTQSYLPSTYFFGYYIELPPYQQVTISWSLSAATGYSFGAKGSFACGSPCAAGGSTGKSSCTDLSSNVPGSSTSCYTGSLTLFRHCTASSDPNYMNTNFFVFYLWGLSQSSSFSVSALTASSASNCPTPRKFYHMKTHFPL